ncbi:hypothetical protein BDN70DRAFT_927133 [Pholiota conissans]|uniref:DUF7770 domain-containing protein n=1 Tax=Pholiota conissans TaxID=109636 RepID=A0A9P5ZDM2_9AGAR|nr:hypothetical protein BDN70DRAFT_927133 [Pholiota conissans]
MSSVCTKTQLDDILSHIASHKNWFAPDLSRDILRTPVTHIHFVGLADEEIEVPNPLKPSKPAALAEEVLEPTNHWVLFLQTTADEFIRVEALPSDEIDETCYIWIDTKDSLSKNPHVRALSFPIVDKTVGWILNNIIERRRDCYIFHPVGEGCRFWVSNIAEDLSDAGVILSANAEVKNIVAFYYDSASPDCVPKPREINEGRFF